MLTQRCQWAVLEAGMTREAVAAALQALHAVAWALRLEQDESRELLLRARVAQCRVRGHARH